MRSMRASAAAMALPMLQPDMVELRGRRADADISRAKKIASSVSPASATGRRRPTSTASSARRVTGEHVPEGLLRTVMPAAPATHIEALRRYGTISFEQAATAAMEIARDGFAVYPLLASNIEYAAEQFARWPDNARVFLPGRKAAARWASCSKQEDLGAHDLPHDRSRARYARRPRQKTARGARLFLSRPDRRRHRRLPPAAQRFRDSRRSRRVSRVPVENSISANYRGYEVHSCDVWCQGIVAARNAEDPRRLRPQKLSGTIRSPMCISSIRRSISRSPIARRIRRSEIREGAARRHAVGCLCMRQRARIDLQRAFATLPDPGYPGRGAGTVPAA